VNIQTQVYLYVGLGIVVSTVLFFVWVFLRRKKDPRYGAERASAELRNPPLGNAKLSVMEAGALVSIPFLCAIVFFIYSGSKKVPFPVGCRNYYVEVSGQGRSKTETRVCFDKPIPADAPYKGKWSS
jgi:hypothetical protein